MNMMGSDSYDLTITSSFTQRSEGVIKQAAADFRVDEELGFLPSGEGEHVFVQLQNSGDNTAYLQAQLAKFAGIPARSVSYSGLKDRHAITTQWFGLHLPGKKSLQWDELCLNNTRVIQAERHNKKLRIGAHKSNAFDILVRCDEQQAQTASDNLEQVLARGFPNYFGLQRFGHNGSNLISKPRNKNQRSLQISAARSFLFNALVSTKVADGSWLNLEAGDVVQLNGVQSIFTIEEVDSIIQRRLDEGDIHPSALLCGDDLSSVQIEELAIIEQFPSLLEIIEKAQVKSSRRATRANAKNLQWNIEKEGLRLKFSLGTGSYATALIGDVFDLGETS